MLSGTYCHNLESMPIDLLNFAASSLMWFLNDKCSYINTPKYLTEEEGIIFFPSIFYLMLLYGMFLLGCLNTTN